MHDVNPKSKLRPLRGLAAVLVVTVLAVVAATSWPDLGEWFAEGYTRLAEGRPAALDLTLLLALLAVALIIGRRARQR